jgi:VIT1/CCC1 family predicted Fe2+/Mn2+ transporter
MLGQTGADIITDVERHEPQSSQPADVLRHYLSDIIFGANDGIITTFAVVSGVTGAHLAPSILIILGCANLLADGFSMGASNFLAIRSGAKAEGKERGVREPLAHAVATFLAFVAAGAVPLVAYVFPGATDHTFLVSCIMTGVILFGVGSMRSWVVSVRWYWSGLEMLGIGAAAAAVAYGVGVVLSRFLSA